MGIDSSTSATKVECRDADTGALVASGRAPHPSTSPPRSEQEPISWWTALLQAAASAGPERTAAVSVAGQQHGLVACAADGRPLRPAKLWNDTESAPDAAWLIDQLGGTAAWAAACGSVPVASFTITKLSWLHRKEPETFRRLARVLLPHDWLTHQLTGAFVTDRGDASGTGYWSPLEGRWRPDVLALVDGDTDWGAALPTVLGPVDAAGTVTPTAAAALPALAGARVGPGTGDNMAAALSLAMGPGDVVVSVGTSGTVSAVTDRPTADPSGTVAGFADASGRFLPLVCTLNASKVTDAFARLAGADPDAFDRLVLDALPGARGLVLLPYLDGERTPDRPHATGVLSGIRSDVTAGEFARAAVEGVVCGLLDGLDALATAAGGLAGRLLLTGGGARSAAYRQILADLSGRPVHAVAAGEQVARGAAIQAAAVLHGADPMVVARSWGDAHTEVITPRLPPHQAAEIRSQHRRQRDATA